MGSSVVLTLDTRAPQVTFGAVGGAEAGQLLQVGYTVDEVGVSGAVVQLPGGGGTLTMDVLADRVEVNLPPDAVEGTAHVVISTLDDVLNAEDFTLDVPIVGIIAAAPPPPASQGLPTAPAPARRSHRRRRSHAHVGSASIVTRSGSTRSQARVTAVHRGFQSIRMETTAVAGCATHRISSSRIMKSPSRIMEVTAITRRPEGPRTEDELIFLDLL